MSEADPQSPIIDDMEIKRKVESIAGKNARVVDCEKKSSFVSEETLLVNGVPVKLEGKAGERIKEALKSGQPPPVELLSEILVQAGIEKNPVQLETTMTVKSSTKTSELSTLRDRNGKLVDEKLKEFEEDDEIQTASVEIWEKDSDEAQKLRKEAQKLRKTFDDLRFNMDPFIIPKPLPRTYTPDRTPPKTPHHSPQTPTTPNGKNSSSPTPFQFGNNKSSMKQPQPPSPSSPHYYSKQRPSEPPPRIPSLMTPLKLNYSSNKPIPPPKPIKSKLKLEKNLELPVRVVYETFI